MSRTILIGLDGATFTVLDALFESGDMPFLKSFVERNSHAQLISPPNCISPAAWTSVITGRKSGDFGIFDFIHCRQTPEGVYHTLNWSYDIRCPTLWTILSQKGLRVAALNFLVSYPPPRKMNGICVPAFTHARHLRQAVYPPAFYEKIQSLLGADATLLAMDMAEEFQAIQFLPADEYEGWISHHIRREEQWFKLVRSILLDDPPDFTAVVFDGVDKLQHLCWRFLDPALLPADPNPWEKRVRELCVSYFRQLDGFIREIVAVAGPARILALSDHGFRETKTVFFANTWLAERGYLHWRDGPGTAKSTQLANELISMQADAIDFDRTTAFAYNPSSNGIYIRRSEGRGSPGIRPDQYDGFCRRLVCELNTVRDPHSGKPFFRDVLTREKAYPGPHNERAPDITLVMNDYGFLSVLNSDEVFHDREEYWGTHEPAGIFIAGGPGIASLGRMPELQLVDVAPILLRSLGLPPEPEMQGRCPAALFNDGEAVLVQPNEAIDAARRLDHAALSDGQEDTEPEPDPEIEAEWSRMLKAMNYL
jgi:predicted AlkP superfamily phosphohydrolase/phosphomutase